MTRRFAVFILSHGRADKVLTVKALRKVGYSGEVYIICDDEDAQLDAYKEAYGDKVCVFNKQQWLDESDTCDNLSSPRGVVLPARNYTFQLAKQLDLDAFLVLDDDYPHIGVKYSTDGVLHEKLKYTNFDQICDDYIELLHANENILTVCFAQSGDFIGGTSGSYYKRAWSYKAMNSFFCLTSRPFKFLGRLNEDLCAAVAHERAGKLFLTVGTISVQQLDTQQNSGGLTESYLEQGTYQNSFYSVIVCPSAVKISAFGDPHLRIHHEVNWGRAAPRILSSKWKK